MPLSSAFRRRFLDLTQRRKKKFGRAAVVHYGTDPKNLSQTAKSHIRLNQAHPDTVFRVRIENLQPRTTYNYSVDSMDAKSNGKSAGIISPVK